MCVIVFNKPKNRIEPSILSDMWDSNNDGAGFMYRENGHNVYEKGFMEFSDFLDHYDIVFNKKIPFAFHLRFATHGVTDKGNTHPFVVNHSKAFMRTTKGRFLNHDILMHNGVISNASKGKYFIFKGRQKIDLYSDTMEFTARYWQHIKKHLARQISSKFLLLTKEGNYEFYNEFKEYEGNLYSNLNFLYKSYTYSYSGSTYYDSTKTIEQNFANNCNDCDIATDCDREVCHYEITTSVTRQSLSNVRCIDCRYFEQCIPTHEINHYNPQKDKGHCECYVPAYVEKEETNKVLALPRENSKIDCALCKYCTIKEYCYERVTDNDRQKLFRAATYSSKSVYSCISFQPSYERG